MGNYGISLFDLKNIQKKYGRTLNCIRRLSPCGRVNVANALDLSWTAADNHLRDLSQNGFLQDEGKKLYKLIPEIAYCAGIAVGTRSIKVSILDFNFDPIKAENVAEFELKNLEQQKDGNEMLFCYQSSQNLDVLTDRLNQILQILLDAFETNGRKLFAVTLAFPGAVDVQQQKIIACPNIGCLAGKSIPALLRDTLLKRMKKNGVTLLVDNNSKTALIAEREHLFRSQDAERRKLAGAPNIAVVYGATGLGCGLSMEYRLQRGTRFAGELGHLTAPDYQTENSICKDTKPVSCSCTNENCLEQMIRTRVFGANSLSAFLEATSEEKLRCFERKHPAEYKVFLQYTGYIINHLINLLDLDALIFTGRLFEHMENFADHLNMLKGKYTLSYTGESCSVLLGWQRADIAAIGAAMEGFLTNGESDCTIQWQKSI